MSVTPNLRGLLFFPVGLLALLDNFRLGGFDGGFFGHLFTRGLEDRLERVLGHVVQNAMDATDPSGRVWLKLMRPSGQALIEIGDTGHGMSQDFVRNQLFKPFQSTKTTGMGIGAFESFQYVQELGGKIEVESVVNRGTVVRVLLPLLEVQKASDIHLPKT